MSMRRGEVAGQEGWSATPERPAESTGDMDVESGSKSPLAVVGAEPSEQRKVATLEYSAPWVAGAWLLAWVVNNIGVNILNKSAFQFVDFPYPYALSAVHMLCNYSGAEIYYAVNKSAPQRKVLTPEQFKTILGFSVLFAANIAIGNASLKYVSVTFNQVMRSLVPGMVMILGGLLLNKTYSTQQKISLIPVCFGVMLACKGEMHFSTLGFFVTCFCVALAASKTVVSSLVMTGEMKMQPLDLLCKMCPLAFVEILTLSLLSGELSSIWSRWDEITQSWAIPVVVMSGFSSFSLNITNFYANKMTSPLTLSVCANAKQVLMIVIATVIFKTPINWVNGIGIFIVLAGGARYSQVSYNESQRGKTPISK